LKIVTANGTGDLDIMVKYGAHASRDDYDCRSQNSGNNEECVITNPALGTYYINAYAYSAYTGAQLTAHLDNDVVQPPTGNVLTNGQQVTGLSSATETLYYTIDVPASQTLNVTTTGGTGDADLYVRAGLEATTSDYDCRAYNSGNAGLCSLTNNSSSTVTYHIMLNPYEAFADVDLRVNY
ncbi:MAG: pre-peptidase C-terminal domain-containing protein, partial [Algicola sp.]|nr:pre-peptidase C-terminal domain-containing protein [Algicola sp.]